MADHPTPDWLGPALASAGTAIVALLGYLGVRSTAKAPKADPQQVQNDGWQELLDQMRLELKAASRERNNLKDTLAAREAAWATERQEFMGQIAQLQAVAEGFERLLRRNGIAIPERKTPPVEVAIVAATLRQGPVDEE